MKQKLLALVIVALCFTMQVFATDYYISNSGSASNSGTSSSSPWTLEKFNDMSQTLQGGDRCLFNRGEVFRGTVKISNNNSSTARFTYGAYGTGAKPVISGAKLITGWANVNGTYEATASDVITHLFVNGKQATIARIPNKGYLWVGPTNNNSLSNPLLNVSPSLVGATWHYRKQNDWITKGLITTHSGSTIGGLQNLVPVQGFYVDDCKAGLDSVWEWWQDDATKKVYLKLPSGMNPSSLTVEGSVIAKGFDAWAPSNLIFDNLDIRYFTEYGMRFNIARYIDVTNCDFKGINIGCIRDEGQEVDRGQNLLVNNCKFYDCNSTAIEVSKASYFTFTNNIIKRIALIPGYEYPTLVAGMGLNTTNVDYGTFTDNIIDSIGYSCIVWSGHHNLFQYNIISRNGFSKNDNGYIQSWGDFTNNSTIRDNIMFGGNGNVEGMDPVYNTRGASEGIYFDDFTRDNKVIGNTVIGGHNGIFIQSSRNFEVKDNVTYDCWWNGLFLNEKNPNDDYSEKQWGWKRDLTGITASGNVFFANSSSQMGVRTSRDLCDTEMDFFTSNNNYIFNPYASNTFVYSKQPCSGNRTDYQYSLKGWQNRYGQEMNSKTNNFIWSESDVQNVGSNLTPNGTFDSDVTGFSAYQANFTVAWASGVTGMNGGCLKVTNREPNGDLSSPAFNVTNGKKYVLRFKIKGSAPGTVNALMVENNPFNYMSPNTYIGYDVNTFDQQIVYTATKTVTVKMSLRFTGQDDVWFDDFSVYEAGSITPVNYYEKSKLFFNDTKASKSFSLNGKTYKDLDGNTVTGSITLDAFKSRILLLSTDGPIVNVTGVSVSPTSVSVGEGGTTNLTATVAPSNASNQSVTWTSSNTSIATVNSSGVVAGVAAGSATITVKTNDGAKTATCAVTVTAPIAPTGVTVSPTTATVNVGATTSLTATVAPSNASNKNVTWSSNNTAIATVSTSGVVTAVAPGTATITVTTVSGAKTATCAITVPAISVTSVSISASTLTVTKGNTATLTATISPSNATNKNVTWSSGNTSVATVSSTGVVTAVDAGTATITVTTADGAKTATCSVTVPNVSGSVIEEVWTNVNGTTVSSIPVTTTPNQTNTLSSLEIPENSAEGYGVRIRGYIVPTTSGSYNFYVASDDNSELWLSTNDQPSNTSKICYVNEWTASKEWTKFTSQKSAAISLTANTKYYFEGLMKEGNGGDNFAIGWTGPGISSVTVIGASNIDKYTGGSSSVAVTGVTVSPTTASVGVGATTTLTATVAPSNASNKNVSWSSNNTAIATVSSTGVVTGVAAGTATITVTTADGAKTATCAVTVTSVNVPVTSVTVSPTTASVAVGATTTLTATVAPSNATNKNVTWSTSASSVATVSSTGVVTGVAAGSATITVTTADGAKTATCAVTVTATPPTGITGTVEAEFWTSLSGTAIPTIPTSAPNSTSTLTSVEIPSNANDNYLVRIRGYIVPSTTGSYTFYIASDDNGQLHLSTNNDPANKAQIAYVGNWTASREWTKETNQKSAAKSLTAGTKYYFEAIAKEGNGGDNLAIGWTGPGISAITVIGAANIDKYVASGGGSVAVTGVTVSPTTLSIAVGGTSTLTATVAPSNATNKNVTWSTSASSIATVSSTGVVTAVATGTATITVTTTDGGKTATCAVTVTGTSGLGTGTGLSFSYFNNKTLTGTAVVTGKEAVDFDWGNSAPKAGVGYDNYSVRWEGYVEAPIATNITFTTIADDGVRLWVDGTLVIDNWVDQAPTSKSSLAISFTAGQRKTIKMEYYEATGGAVAKLHWAYTGVGTQAIPAKYLYDTSNKTTFDTEEKTAIANNTYAAVMIYPNPVSGVLHIANADLNANITIYSIEGKVITNLKANSENMNIDVAGFNKGLYILSIQGANQNVVTRLVVK